MGEGRCPMSITATPTATDLWQSHADDLADFALARLVNRTDVWGLYRRWTDSKGGAHKVFTAPAKRDRGRVTLTGDIITRHYTDPGDGATIGIHSTSSTGTCRWFAIDIDRHDDDDPTPPETYEAAALHWLRKAEADGLNVVLEDSNGAGGYHLWCVFTEPLPVARVYDYARWLVSDYADHGLREAPETFPKQRTIGEGYGNWLRLPGTHHTRDHLSRFYDGQRWTDGPGLWLGMAFNDDLPDREPPAEAAPDIRRTGDSDTYRGRVVDQYAEGSQRSDAIALVLVFELSEQYEAGQWTSTAPLRAEGRFWIVGRGGEINGKVASMLAESIGWRGDITDGAQDDLHPCQVVIEDGVARWLRAYDAPTPLDKYIDKMPTGLRAGDHRSDAAYTLAAHCTNDLGMSEASALPYLQLWNSRQAEPLPDEKLIDTARNATVYAKGAKR